MGGFYCFLWEQINCGRLIWFVGGFKYNIQESISVHPTRRQNFAGKVYSIFPNIWEWVIQSNLPFQRMENMRQKFVFVAFSVSSSLPTSQMECHKSLFYFVVGIFSFVSLSLSTANPCDSIQMFLPLLCLYCWMSAAAGLFQVSHIQLNPASTALDCEESSPAQ